MTRALAHRGPDGDGIWVDPARTIALGHRRLAIIDLSPRGAQPFHSKDGRFALVFNGELYNFVELRKECEALGSSFFSDSDTEVVLESIRHWGVDAFTRFRGMWALVLTDHRERRIILSRDHFGIKPLYYGELGGNLFIGSEPKALLAADPLFADPDETTVRLFEEDAWVDRGSYTFFRRIRRFPPSAYASLSFGSIAVRPQKFWVPGHVASSMSPATAVETLRSLLEESIRLQLRSDVPVGACLSGGLDSSTIVTLASRALPAESRDNLRTFTVHYPSLPEVNEAHWARLVATQTGTRSSFHEPTAEGLAEDFTQLLRAQDEPFGSTSIYAQFQLFRSIRAAGIKVVLDGQGADELLAGYHGLIPGYLLELLLTRSWSEVATSGLPLALRYRVSPWATLRTFLASIFRSSRRALNLQSPIGVRLPTDEYHERRHELHRAPSDFAESLADMVTDTNLPQLLRYEDRNSMASSIEARVPFLDPHLVDHALAIPAALKYARGWTKFPLRKAMEDLLPPEVTWRVSKLGFPTPEVDWLRSKFGLDVATPGASQWRKFVVRKWREVYSS